MKTIPKSILFVIGLVVVMVVIFSVFGVYSGKVPAQRQIIHIFDQPNQMLSNPNGLIEISDIKPNSMVWFYYPDPDRFKNRDPFDQFLLIRLPDYLGGSVDDASAFRAYSAIDPSSHCFVKYWPEDGRKIIQDPCGGNMYEPVTGLAIEIQGNPILVSKNLGLPYIRITSDENGFLYAEPPTWTEDQNGSIGIGRKISEQELKSTIDLIANQEKKVRDAMEKFSVPKELSTGHTLDNIFNSEKRKNTAEYTLPNSEESHILLSYEYCNCTKPKDLLASEEMTKANSQIMDVDGIPIVAYPNKINYVNDSDNQYMFVFYDKGFKISFSSEQNLDAGLGLVKELLEFWK